MDGLHGGLAQDGGAAHHAVQARVAGHLDDGGDAPAFLAHEQAPGVLEFHLAAGVAAVAHLVLQALHAHGVAAAVRAPARHIEAGERAALAGARHHQVRIALWRREEPLVSAQPVFAAAPARADGCRHGGVGAHVRSALLLGHAHAQPDAGLVRHGQVARVVGGAVEPGLQRLPQRGLLAQQRDGGLRHRGGAQRALLHLAVQVKARRPCGPAARSLVLEGPGDQPLAAVQRHELVPRGVELQRVDAPPARVKALQLRRVAVGLLGQGVGLGHAQPCGVGVERRARPVGARTLQRLAQRCVGGQRVVVVQLGVLVEDLVGGPVHGAWPPCCRGTSLGALRRPGKRVSAEEGDVQSQIGP